jgi:hypothetical protein
MTNRKTALDHLDDATRGRLHLSPSDRIWNRPGQPEIDPALPDVDKDLMDTLRGEAPENVGMWGCAGLLQFVSCYSEIHP